MKTIQEAAQTALDCQDACNLSGVIRSFALATEILWQAAREAKHGTDWVNQHPISILYADKIADLATHHRHVTEVRVFGDAYEACKRLVEGGKL